MTVIFHANCNGVPTLAGDVLVSGPESEDLQELVLPNHVSGISTVFPKGSGFVPKGMKRKLFIVNRRMAVGVSGRVIHMARFVKDLQDRFAGRDKFTFAAIESYFNDYDREIIGNVVAIILYRVDEVNRFAVVGNWTGGALIERKFPQFGKVLAVGSGNATLVSEIERMDRRFEALAIGNRNHDRIYHSLVMQLSLFSQILKIDNLAGRSLLEYWGGAFEIIYLNERGNYQFLENQTIVYWHLDLDDPGSDFSPLGVVKQEYRDCLLVIHVYEQGQFKSFGARDVTGKPRVDGELTLSMEDLDYNSEIICNAVLVSRGGVFKTIYNVVDKHTSEHPGMVFLEIDDDNRLRVYMASEQQKEIHKAILDNEEKLGVKQRNSGKRPN